MEQPSPSWTPNPSGKLPREATAGQIRREAGGGGVRGLPLASPGRLAGTPPPNPLGPQARGQRPRRTGRGLEGKRGRLEAPELMGPDPFRDVRAPESFPGYSSTAQTSRFWGGNLFSKFLDLSSPSPAGRIGLDQCPLSAPPQPPSSGFSTELPGHCFPPQEVSDALRWILFSLLSGQLIFFPVRKKKKRFSQADYSCQ